MKEPCKLCLVQPACTTKCKERKIFEKNKRLKRENTKEFIYDSIGVTISMIVVLVLLVAMMSSGAR